jgi:hypothetical protein
VKLEMPNVPLSVVNHSQSLISSASGSFLWQAGFLSFAVILVLFEVVHSWRLGLIRQLVRIAALGAAMTTSMRKANPDTLGLVFIGFTGGYRCSKA